MIAIVDYGAGNLNSVVKAFRSIGAQNYVLGHKQDYKKSTKFVLPGVGSFKEAIYALERLGLIGLLKEEVLIHKKPILGICLGMQLFLTRGYEGGFCEGFDFIEGEVVKFEDEPGFKIPHMGWNEIEILRQNPLYEGIENHSDFYFIHSFYASCKDEFISAKTQYICNFAASIQKDNIFGVQFHPEKSQKLGLRLLANFARL